MQHQPTAGCDGLGRRWSMRASRSKVIAPSNGSAIQVALKSVLLEPGWPQPHPGCRNALPDCESQQERSWPQQQPRALHELVPSAR